ncbi:Hydroxylamine reductase [Methanosarcina sp. WWM596]|nr:Hydroxylamine reductase [Methanosarcina sp. WWM596]
MFCNQCEEALSGKGCTKNGVCGKFWLSYIPFVNKFLK